MELLNPRNDFLFKRIFGSEENRDLLVHFLNAVFDDSGQALVTTVELLNPFIDKDAVDDKLSVLDIKARTESGTLIDVEIQIVDHHDMAPRTVYYWAKLFEQQLAETEHYRALHKTVTINILDFSYLPSVAYHTTFHLREDATHALLTDLCEIHFVELPKLEMTRLDLNHPLIRWMLFLTTQTPEQLEALAMDDPVMKKAVTTLEFLSQDRQIRERYLARQKGRQTYAADMDAAREEGLQQGLEQGVQQGLEQGVQQGLERGVQQGLEQAARRLLRMGFSAEQIYQATGLPVHVVASLMVEPE